MDPDPAHFVLLNIAVLLMSTSLTLGLVLLVVLIICSALISGSEVAFFSLNPKDIHFLEDEKDRSADIILEFQEKPRTLLATILICNNFINIAIVVVSNYLVEGLLGPERLKLIGNSLYSILGFMTPNSLASIFNFLVTVLGVTMILVLFGEIAPKVYANLNNLKFAKRMAIPLAILSKLCSPFSSILVGLSNKLEAKFNSNSNLNSTTREDIDKAIELSVSEGQHATEEVDILKGIVKFGDVTAKQIMKSRVDVVALDEECDYKEVLDTINSSGYSRIPVFKDDFDTLTGILYVKDLLGHASENKDFDWKSIVREGVLYVPESKKIDDLLREFQLKRTHIGIVVDEYGGSSGLITLEDVMEEVVGDIKDEFDDSDDIEFIQIGKDNYIFEGKSMINDVCKVIGKDTAFFDGIRGSADSLAGLILETTGIIPKPEKRIVYKNIEFNIVSVTKRRIEKINVKILNG